MNLNETHRKLIEVGEKILKSSRNELYISMRFLDTALSGLSYEMNLSTLYTGTDGIKILYNPRFLTDKYLSDRILVNRLYMHMILHCIFRHPFNRGKKNEELYNIACDIAVESIIDSLPFKCLKLTVSDKRVEVYERLRRKLKVLTAEGIYEKLKEENLSVREIAKLQLEFRECDHVFWQNDDDKNNNDNQNDRDNDNNNENNSQNELSKKWQDISEKTQTNLETLSRDIGDMVGDIISYLKVENRERYNYKRFLEKFVTLSENIHIDDDSYDYIFYTYGLNIYGNMPLIEPLEYKEEKKIEELVIAIDTSESCEGDTIKTFLEETYSILLNNESFFRKFNVHIIQCDAGIQRDFKAQSKEDIERFMDNFQISGMGGTDFRPTFEYVEKLIEEGEFKNLKGLIYFTDGWGVFPKKMPSFETAFVFIDEEYNDKTVPPWALKVVLGKNDILERRD
ncbi:metallopeptidase [Tyzzerella sp. An114]|uniref:vWA domain-containing protein n=1 Tax=Tyzzerella sp. An114 TaxID=1965545 RepID=UPI000B449BAA|nr:metallopeptidase [Tyzzerella sp. An114]